MGSECARGTGGVLCELGKQPRALGGPQLKRPSSCPGAATAGCSPHMGPPDASQDRHPRQHKERKTARLSGSKSQPLAPPSTPLTGQGSASSHRPATSARSRLPVSPPHGSAGPPPGSPQSHLSRPNPSPTLTPDSDLSCVLKTAQPLALESFYFSYYLSKTFPLLKSPEMQVRK